MGSNKVRDDMVKGFIHSSVSCGEFEIVEYKNKRDVTVMFLETGTKIKSRTDLIRAGKVTDYMSKTVLGIACHGYGEFSTTTKVCGTSVYQVWRNMLSRCYDEKSEHYHRYGGRGVLVCEDWKNYQNFANWYVSNHPGGKVQIDKDIKVEGNKIYSPVACILVSKLENIMHMNKQRMKRCVLISPCGEEHDVLNVSEFARDNGLFQSLLQKVIKGERKHHKGWKVKL